MITRLLILTFSILAVTAGAVSFGVIVGWMLAYPARVKLRFANANLLQRIDDLVAQALILRNTVDNMRNEHGAVLDIASNLANVNTQLITRFNLQMQDGPGQASTESTPETQAPTYQGTPGMTTCLTCGSVVATPENAIPGAWLLQHTGHQINIALNQEKYAADLRAAEVEEMFKDGDIIGGD